MTTSKRAALLDDLRRAIDQEIAVDIPEFLPALRELATSLAQPG